MVRLPPMAMNCVVAQARQGALAAGGDRRSAAAAAPWRRAPLARGKAVVPRIARVPDAQHPPRDATASPPVSAAATIPSASAAGSPPWRGR